MFYNDICLFTGRNNPKWHTSSNTNGLKISKKSSSFETKIPQIYSGQYDAKKKTLRVKAFSVIAKVLSYHLRHHSLCLCRTVYV